MELWELWDMTAAFPLTDVQRERPGSAAVRPLTLPNELNHFEILLNDKNIIFTKTCNR
jgi:hypothetical protein